MLCRSKSNHLLYNFSGDTIPFIIKNIFSIKYVLVKAELKAQQQENEKLRDLITDTAEERKIPFQRAALSRATGTDTDAFAYSNGGVASALISLPLRYMHTTVEMVHRDDVENVIRLIYESLLKIKNGDTFSYFE